MLTTVPLPSSASSTCTLLSVPKQKNYKASFHSLSLKLSSLHNGNNTNSDNTDNVATTSIHNNPSRRLALFQLGAALPESHLLGGRASKLLRVDGNTSEASTSSKMASMSTALAEQNVLEWVSNDKRRMLHVVYRVGDLDKTIKFYTECLGMKLLRKRNIPEERYSNAFLGYGPEESNFTVELTYNYGIDKYNIGNGFGHFGIAVEDVVKTVNLVKAKGGRITRDSGPVKGGGSIIAYVQDPDGYTFELLERGPTPEPLCQVMLRVGDLERSVNFYKKAFGLQLLRKRDDPESKYSVAIMGYGPEDKNAVLELTYNYGITEYEKGDGYAQVFVDNVDFLRELE
ncbi:lactoylglutathione lyase GLX1 isoform X2 [Ricinus communis]|uniref:lactoylglutathione lyase GLX1 isoform X2 n=1 Tax=Ricinus communis TaxID=3988 RepID=UPI000772B02D|nr:lactoylglutathione lyase GLX1 isoform X2 [Ricinus communis]|eukprot:XP_015573177.1 lactoylglutathione lyase GLX1 isoform X2 [Ricinus communis]